MSHRLPLADIRFIADASDCPECDGFGRVWNNADPTSGQSVDCSVCLEALLADQPEVRL